VSTAPAPDGAPDPGRATGTGADRALLEVRDLAVTFNVRGQKLRAVDGVSFDLRPGESLGIIGESGSGKSTIARAVVGLVRPAAGTISLAGTPIQDLKRRARRRIASRIQMIFQDPRESLDPHLTARESIAEPLIVRGGLAEADLRRRVDEALDQTGLSARYAGRRPAELSGGQQQRVCIARAIALDPDILICDEAVSALDVSVQADILNLLTDLQAERRLSYLFISHDIGVVSHVCDRVGVTYLGQLVETGSAAQIVSRPAHPYTEALLSAEPQALPSRMRSRSRIVLEGEMPSPLSPPSGCRFRTRCRYAQEICETTPPAVVKEPGQTAACHFTAQLDLAGGARQRQALLAAIRPTKEKNS
jgi:peptide/nickel transport system ATP-binding protein/oligopeptide transport system ATP-binding protein